MKKPDQSEMTFITGTTCITQFKILFDDDVDDDDDAVGTLISLTHYSYCKMFYIVAVYINLTDVFYMYNEHCTSCILYCCI